MFECGTEPGDGLGNNSQSVRRAVVSKIPDTCPGIVRRFKVRIQNDCKALRRVLGSLVYAGSMVHMQKEISGTPSDSKGESRRPRICRMLYSTALRSNCGPPTCGILFWTGAGRNRRAYHRKSEGHHLGNHARRNPSGKSAENPHDDGYAEVVSRRA
jgi:hypothetical protein